MQCVVWAVGAEGTDVSKPMEGWGMGGALAGDAATPLRSPPSYQKWKSCSKNLNFWLSPSPKSGVWVYFHHAQGNGEDTGSWNMTWIPFNIYNFVKLVTAGKSLDTGVGKAFSWLGRDWESFLTGFLISPGHLQHPQHLLFPACSLSPSFACLRTYRFASQGGKSAYSCLDESINHCWKSVSKICRVSYLPFPVCFLFILHAREISVAIWSKEE